MASCPVCAFDGLTKPPVDFTICPSCGTEFGYDDVGRSFDELRQDWIWSGAVWFSNAQQPPPGWSGYQQLLRHGLALVPLASAEDQHDESPATFSKVAHTQAHA
jgi:hypothetical protein